MLAIIAGRTQGHRLDQRATAENVQDLPGDAAGIEGIARQRPALLRTTDGSLLRVGVVVKVEQRDIAQFEVREIGEYILSQLDAFKARVGITRRNIGCWSDIGLIGGWPWDNLISKISSRIAKLILHEECRRRNSVTYRQSCH